MSDLTLISPAFEHQGAMPPKYSCDAENVSPPLSIDRVPEGTQSLVLIMDDPDAIKPVGKVWDHWVIWNISPQTVHIEEGKEPGGALGANSSGGTGYTGACPPDGEHRYVFKLYALDTALELPEGATKQEVLKAMAGHVLEEAELIGTYER